MSNEPRRFFDHRNRSIRIDMFEELSDHALAALRSFARRIGAPHLLEEVILPKLREGDSQVFVAVQDRPWPPWGLGAALKPTAVLNSPVVWLDMHSAPRQLPKAPVVLNCMALSPKAEL
jgi:hypothetical protein